MMLTVNHRLPVNIFGTGCFASGPFYVIIYTEVMQMNTAEIIVIIVCIMMFAFLVWVIHKTGGDNNDSN